MSNKKIYRAGIIPYYVKNGEIKMLFMLPSNSKYGGPYFQIGKGKIDPGETAIEAATREGKEELGFSKLNVKGDIEKLGVFLGRTTIFIAEIKDKNMFSLPGNETKKTKWLTPGQFAKIGRPIHKPIIKAVVRHIS